MKIRTAFLSMAMAAGLMGVSHGAAFTIDFNGYSDTGGANVAGQDGWTINEPTPNVSFTLPYNGTTAAGLGGRFANSTVPTVQLTHSVPSQSLVDTTLTLDFAMIASTGIFEDNKDSFGFSVQGAGGADLLTFTFFPSVATGEENFMNVFVSTNGGSPVQSSAAFQYGGPTSFSLTVSQGTGGDVDYFAEFTAAGTAGFGGTIAGGSAASVEGISLNFTKAAAAAGNNYMIVDNIVFNQVPEVSSSLLVLGAAAPLLARRRRK